MKTLGGYIRIEGMAGQGGFGYVYRGYDTRMERPVAIKIIKTVGNKEAKILSRLDHKGLPRLYDIFAEDDKTYMVMEWVEGVDLGRYIEENGAMPESMVMRIGIELLDILEYLHSCKPCIIYQDLKPANIMLMPDGHIKLVDFGTALIIDYGENAGNLAGTIGYGAPEQRGLTQVRHASERSDIYSWGAVMYSLLSGQLLNKPPYTMQKIKLVCPEISISFRKVIEKCTRRDEEARYSGIQDIRNALKYGTTIDILAYFAFAAGMITCILPFIYMWFVSWRGGLFEELRRHLELDYTKLRWAGMLLITICWMIYGLKLLSNRRFLRIKRSVFLSEKRYPGLWIATVLLLIGSSYLAGGGAKFNSVGGNNLPVSVLDEYGNTCLVRYDSVYSAEGDLRLCIDADTLSDMDYGELVIQLDSKDLDSPLTRTLLIKNAQITSQKLN